jgi:hypothetical protein
MYLGVASWRLPLTSRRVRHRTRADPSRVQYLSPQLLSLVLHIFSDQVSLSGDLSFTVYSLQPECAPIRHL